MGSKNIQADATITVYIRMINFGSKCNLKEKDDCSYIYTSTMAAKGLEIYRYSIYNIYTYMYIYVYLCISMYIYMYICIYVYMYICIDV